MSSGFNKTPGRIWDGRTGKPVAVLNGHTDVITLARFSKDEKQVLTGAKDNTARLWDVATGEVIHTFKHGSMIATAEFSPDGKTILTAPSGRLSAYTIVNGYRLGGTMGRPVE